MTLLVSVWRLTSAHAMTTSMNLQEDCCKLLIFVFGRLLMKRLCNSKRWRSRCFSVEARSSFLGDNRSQCAPPDGRPGLGTHVGANKTSPVVRIDLDVVRRALCPAHLRHPVPHSSQIAQEFPMNVAALSPLIAASRKRKGLWRARSKTRARATRGRRKRNSTQRSFQKNLQLLCRFDVATRLQTSPSLLAFLCFKVCFALKPGAKHPGVKFTSRC